jgi:nucleoside-triphosphatase THEP1
MIYILTGAIRTGKTTALLNWINNRNDVDGLLCPDNENGKRYFLKVKTKEEFLLEVRSEDSDQDVVTVGSFQFLKSAFEEANTFLISKGNELASQYLIIDELGKLELKNEGLHSAVELLMPVFSANAKKHLIVVIRNNLLNEILNHYAISNYCVLSKEELDFI